MKVKKYKNYKIIFNKNTCIITDKTGIIAFTDSKKNAKKIINNFIETFEEVS